MKKITTLLVTIALSVLGHAYAAEKTEIIIGTTPGDFADLVKEGLNPELEKKGYKIKLVEFTDYVKPNLALAEGSLDVNIFQHKPYLEDFAKEKKLQLSTIAEVPTAPLGLYAGKSKTLAEVKSGTKVGVPNDPTNLARALVILADLGWIKLSKNVDSLKVSTREIETNIKNIVIVQLEAAQLPRSLSDLDYAVINGNYATNAGIALTSALSREKSNAYINWAVVKDSDLNTTYVKDVAAALKSKAIKDYAKVRFKGYKLPSTW